ncbi:hypothetical protein HRbin36_00467 [bacterium HR36]|nr:hypothetical protein HRbin36_00467 [bacterium HR36]
MKIYLVPEDGSRPYELVKDITLIGRSRICDIQLLDKSVSKLHCVLVKTDSLVLVRDLGSTNGTRVKDMLVKRGVLLPNDELTVARLKFRLQFVADNAAAPLPKQEWIATEPIAREAIPETEEDSELDHGPVSSPLPPQVPEIEPVPEPPPIPSVPPVVRTESPDASPDVS